MDFRLIVLNEGEALLSSSSEVSRLSSSHSSSVVSISGGGGNPLLEPFLPAFKRTSVQRPPDLTNPFLTNCRV